MKVSGPVLEATHSVVEVTRPEVEDDGWALSGFEERSESLCTGASGAIGVEGDDQRVRKLGERDGDGFVSVRRAEHGDGAVAGDRGGQRVDGAFGNYYLPVPNLDGTCSCYARIGGEVGSGVEVAGPVGPGVGDAELRVDSVTATDHWQHDTDPARHAVGTGLHAWAEIRSDAVLDEDVTGQAADLREPATYRSALGLPEPLGTFIHVPVEPFGIAAPCRRERPDTRRAWSTSPFAGFLGVANSTREVGHGLAGGASTAGEHEVDRGAAVATAVATPALFAAAAGEDADRRGAARLRVPAVGAGPHARPTVGSAGA